MAFAPYPAHADATRDPIVIGLDARMSPSEPRAGEAIERGALLAIDEINAAGGVLGRRFELMVKDNRGNPARRIDNIDAFAQIDNLVAVIGGSLTPVALAQLEIIRRHKILYLGPWAAGTGIVDNQYEPNFVFRVSMRDEHAGGFLVDAARQRGFHRPGLLLWRTGWGRSNEKAMTSALGRLGRQPAATEWFNTAEPDISGQIETLSAAGADAIMLVAGPREGALAIRNMAARPSDRRLPIISHWGITIGDFHNGLAAEIASVDLSFLQTFSFAQPPFPGRAERVYRAYCAKFQDCTTPDHVTSAVGTAHAYDLVHLLRLAVESAGSIDRESVRTAMEHLPRYEGLVRNYDPAFTPDRHDAPNASDFHLSRYSAAGGLQPVRIE